jgi:hypothetical protein
MTTQAEFLTPKKKARPRTKLRTATTPTAFSAITQNLQKAFSQISVSPSSVPDFTIPDLSSIQLPDTFTDVERKSTIQQMAVNFAASMAGSIRTSSPKISFKDYETQHANDIKPIETPITDSADSFLTGLFQFRRAREQFRGWESATFISQYQATSANTGNADNDDDLADKSNWDELKIDLFKDFEKIDLNDFKAWAQSVWLTPNATVESQDGQSSTYARKVFSEFLFGSRSPELQKAIQNAIPLSKLWNDGPFVWAVLIHRFFPSAIVLRTTILGAVSTKILFPTNHRLPP